MNEQEQLNKTINTVLRLGLLILLFGLAFKILLPFISMIIWGIIIAVAIYPIYKGLSSRLRNHGKIASALITLVFLAIIVLPSIQLATSMVTGLRSIRNLETNTIDIPPPPDMVAKIPLIGKSIDGTWHMASDNLEDAIHEFKPQIITAGTWLLNSVVGTGLGFLQFIVSIIIAGVLLNFAKGGGEVTHGLFKRLAGDKGKELADMTEKTIRNVTRGILGVSFIQALLIGVGLMIAGVPAAGLWTLISLLLSIVQIGVMPVTIPIMIYIFYTASTTTAVLLTIWLTIATLTDNVLKPIILGKGAPVPMLVIFLGAIGGFITMGFLGLFLGAVIMSLAYKLFLVWLAGNDKLTSEPKPSA